MFKDNKKLVAETIFIKEALKLNLSLNEFLLLLYFDNSYDSIFDIALLSKTLNMSEEQILQAYGSLMAKKLIKVVAIKDGYGKVIEKVSLDNFYNEIKTEYKTKEEEVKKEVKPLVNNDEEKIIKLFDDEDSDDFDLPPLR